MHFSARAAEVSSWKQNAHPRPSYGGLQALIPQLDRGHTGRPTYARSFLLRHRLGIYRRYPLGRLPALRNAWRITRDGSAASLRSAGHDTPLGMAISLYTDDPDVL